jgi:RimJ/RimL family protein N-acetyltransferase
MNSTEMGSNGSASTRLTKTPGEPLQNTPTIRVKELCERDRRSLLMHFLDLSDADRLLRFGAVLPDELITKYVQKINFSRDSVFGVFDSGFQLVGVGHLAYLPREALSFIENVTTKNRTAEFGVSVSPPARGMGIGTKLFQRAEIHCRNADVDTLYIHCLSSNHVMMHLAVKADMEIHSNHGETDAFLKLRPATPSSMMREAVDEQSATLDYAMKANTRTAAKWLECFPVFKTF